MSQRFDVIIVGGGMAGASLAIALSGHGLKLALVEAAPLEVRSVPNYDSRGIALAWGSQRILDSLGIWRHLADQAQPIEHIHISEQGGFGITRLHAAEQQVPALGQVISAHDLGVGLLQTLSELKDIELIAPERVRWINPEADQVQLGLKHRNLAAAVVVAADGGNSFVRQQLGIAVKRREYRQSAITANLTPGKAHHNVAYERFTRHGPMALLPMSENRCALVWTVNDAQLGATLALSDAHFMQRVQDIFGWRLGRLQRVGERNSYPLVQLFAANPVKPRSLVIGNAAHTLHPVAGQGFNLGIRDVAVLAEILLQAHHRGEDPGAPEVLQRYASWRRRDQQQVVGFTDALVRIFSNDFLPLKLGRNLGLSALELCPPARQRIAAAAMGLSGHLPRLARGVPL